MHSMQGMRQLMQHLESGVAVRRPMWVARMERRADAPAAWDLTGEGGRHLGTYDCVVIAHNGEKAEHTMVGRHGHCTMVG